MSPRLARSERVVAVLALGWLLGVSPGPATESDAWSRTPQDAGEVATRFLATLTDFARGEPDAAAAWEDLSSRLPAHCLEPARDIVEDVLVDEEPAGATLMLAAFYTALAAESIRPPEVERLSKAARARSDEWLAALEEAGAADDALRLRTRLGVEIYDLDWFDAPERALATFDDAVHRAVARPSVDSRSSDPEALAVAAYWLGTTQAMLGRHADAAKSFARVGELRPDDAEAWLKLGVSRARGGEIEAAREAFERAVVERAAAEEPDDREHRRHDHHWARALAYQELARLERDQSDAQAEARALARGLAEFPTERGLQRVELARLETLPAARRTPTDEARRLELLDALIEPAAEPSLRLRYDSPTRDGIRDLDDELERRLEPLAERLTDHRERITTTLRARRVDRSCQ